MSELKELKFYRLDEVRERLGDVSRQFVDRVERMDPTFPRRIRVGGINLWSAEALTEWMLSKMNSAQSARVPARTVKYR